MISVIIFGYTILKVFFWILELLVLQFPFLFIFLDLEKELGPFTYMKIENLDKLEKNKHIGNLSTKNEISDLRGGTIK